MTKFDIAKEVEAIYGEDSGRCEDYFDFEKISEYLNRYKQLFSIGVRFVNRLLRCFPVRGRIHVVR